ncbi:hypothetical protein EGW08_020846 [Elysia chlorotica]|uniref:Metallo-beta-lactamase domain-containing protein n=1 Tax=Elysia chlorotica TaxID=188477 RepID=A0A433SQ70_ELYCH|nr:hypothetical protein EGW08_020846 [Elysia chlorotica]
MGSCMFKAGYTLYADTCIGRCIHNRIIANFQKQFGENAMHSKLTPFVFQELLILPIPVLVNNYAYLVADLSDHIFILVDVGDATIIKRMQVQPEAVLTTHKHWDHSGGNRLMRSTFPGLKVYGGVLDHVPDSTHNVNDGQELRFGKLKFTAMWTPGHTKGHTVWRLDGSDFGCADSVFTGDLLMLGGCGAAFEGPVRQLAASLDMMKALPEETMVWPGHELALENLELAVFIEPENISALLKLVWAFNRREAKVCTCPSTIGEEKSYNPFLRTQDPQMLAALGIAERVRCPNHPMTSDQINELSFDMIIAYSAKMSQLKRAMRHAQQERNRDQRAAQPTAANNAEPQLPQAESPRAAALSITYKAGNQKVTETIVA